MKLRFKVVVLKHTCYVEDTYTAFRKQYLNDKNNLVGKSFYFHTELKALETVSEFYKHMKQQAENNRIIKEYYV